MVYFVMGLALFADEDYEEVWARITETLAGWGCWDDSQADVTTGGITQARQRLGHEPVKETFAQVAGPVATLETEGAFLGPWRKMSIDGLEWDVPGHEGERGGVRVPRRREGRQPGGVSQGQGGDDRRVRVARPGAGRDRPVRLQGQRRAVAGAGAVPAAGRGLAADRGPELL